MSIDLSLLLQQAISCSMQTCTMVNWRSAARLAPLSDYSID
jgi:hypothetical protein